MSLRFVLLLLASLLAGCATNPVSGRSDFVMMSERQELELGRKYHQQVLAEYPRYADEALQAYVQQVGERVARHSHRSGLQYRFTVIDSPELNAFALPGGYVYIHRGLLAYLNSEAELAAVLGHEVGHVTARHSVRQQSQASAWSIVSQVIAIGTGVGAAGDLTSVLGNAVVRGYGRDMELEADGLGAQYLARAGYDPQAMIEVVRILKNQEDFVRAEAARHGEAPPAGSYHGLFDSHPDNDRRLHEVLGPARALVSAQQEVNRDGFLQHLEGLTFGDSEASGVRRGQAFYHGPLNFTLRLPAGWQLLNRPDMLVGLTPDRKGLIALTLEPADARLTPVDFLRQRIGDQRLLAGEVLQTPGLQGYTGVVPGVTARRVAVLYKGDQAFLFVAALKGRSDLSDADAGFLQVIRSFRPLRDDERKLAKPLRLELVRVGAGQRLADFDHGLAEASVQRLRLLNNLYPDREPRPGDWIKVLY